MFNNISLRISILFILIAGITFSQDKKILDSLLREIKNAKTDTARLHLTVLYKQESYDTSIPTLDSLLKEARRLNYPDVERVILNNMCVLYTQNGDMVNALEYALQNLKVCEKMKYDRGIAQAYSNLGLIYDDLGDDKQSLDYLLKSLELRRKIGDKNGIATTLNNISSYYKSHKQALKALDYLKESVSLLQEIGNMRSLGQVYNNIGVIYYDDKNLDSAEFFINKGRAINLGIKNYATLAHSYTFLGNINLERNNIPKAFYYGDSSLTLAKKFGGPSSIRRAASLMKRIWIKKSDYKKAMEMYELFITMKDSISNEDTRKAGVKKQLQYEYAKKQVADSLKTAGEKKIVEAQLKQEKTQRFALYGGLILVVIFAVFMFNRFRITRRQNVIIEEQKNIVEEKQKEILDSINYAKRLQEAILPPLHLFKKHLTESFILYKPKDIVAGDFYWMEMVPGTGPQVTGSQNKTILLAACDCTGHGVPGAMVSVVCSNALNRTVKEFGITEPGKILDKARELVIETFAKSDKDVKDGMDISLVALPSPLQWGTAHEKNSEILQGNSGYHAQWSGANNPLWYFDKKNGIIKEITANKQPIGKTESPAPFTTHTLEINPGDMIYLFTDGFADQFGGPKGKKFKYKPMQQLLIANSGLNIQEQQKNLDKAFEDWKKDLEQIDDVLVIGVKI